MDNQEKDLEVKETEVKETETTEEVKEEEVKEEKGPKVVEDRQPKALMITLGINGDKTPLKIVSTSEDGNVSTDDVLTALATIEVNTFVMLIQRAIITNNTGMDVMTTYEFMEEAKMDMVSKTILNIIKNNVKMNVHPIYNEILKVINENAKENIEMLQKATNQTASGIVLPS